ncbi:hypothetical protein Tco_0144093 [Tanacetum coccineum]
MEPCTRSSNDCSTGVMNMGQDRTDGDVRMSGIRLFKMQFRIRVVRIIGNRMGKLVFEYEGIGNGCEQPGEVRDKEKGCCLSSNSVIVDQKEETGIQLQAEEFDLMATAADLDEIEEVNANCILMLICSTQSKSEEQYTEILEPIPEPHQVQQNDNVISDISGVEQEGGTVDQHTATVEETRAYFESLYNNLALEVEKVNSVNRKLKETNADLTTELARYKNQEK